MVCPRCIEVVSNIFQEIEIPIVSVALGKVILDNTINKKEKGILQKRLAEKGFELLDDKTARLINEIKSIIIDRIHYQKEPATLNLSTIITEKIPYDYTYLSRLFSSVEGRTIEKFVMLQKIEKVKELLTYKELTISEIAHQLHYSSSAHLSSQFKKVTGMPPQVFRKMQNQARQSLDEL